MYDAQLGTFHTIDPMSDFNHSTYQYVSNNPIIRIDPNGMDDFQFDDMDGRKHHWWERDQFRPWMELHGLTYPNSHKPNYSSITDPDEIHDFLEENVAYSEEHAPSDKRTPSPQGNGKIDISTSNSPFNEVLSFIKRLPHDNSFRGKYVGDYFEKTTVPSGTWNYGFNRSDNTVMVHGINVWFSISFDQHNQLTAVVGGQPIKSPNGVMVYQITAYGTRDENLTGAIKPEIFTIRTYNKDLYNSMMNYLKGKSDKY
jgi:hypothetical protein